MTDMTEAQLLARESQIAEFLSEGEAEADAHEQEALREHHHAQVAACVEIDSEGEILDYVHDQQEEAAFDAQWGEGEWENLRGANVTPVLYY